MMWTSSLQGERDQIKTTLISSHTDNYFISRTSLLDRGADRWTIQSKYIQLHPLRKKSKTHYNQISLVTAIFKSVHFVHLSEGGKVDDDDEDKVKRSFYPQCCIQLLVL